MATLARLRRRTPARDRRDRALKPAPYLRFFSDGHVRSDLWAKSLDDLGTYFGEHGEGAVHDARLSAVSTWLMGRGAVQPGASGASDAIALYRAYVLNRANYPRPDRHPWRSLLANMSRQDREAIERFALEIIGEWEAAGSPNLQTWIRTTQQILLSCLRNQRDRQAASEALAQHQQSIERIVSHGT
jgi:hypothetical protein